MADAAVELWGALKRKSDSEVVRVLESIPDSMLKKAVSTPDQGTGSQPLLYAVNEKLEPTTVEALIKAGADVNAPGLTGKRQTPLLAACWGEDDINVLALLSHNAKLSLTDATKQNCLHVCAKLGSHGLMHELLERAGKHKKDLLLAKDADGSTPLHIAMQELMGSDKRYQLTVDTLLEAIGLRPSITTSTYPLTDGDLPKGHIIELLEDVDNEGCSVLHLATRALATEAVTETQLRRMYESIVGPFLDDDKVLLSLLGARDGDEEETPLHITVRASERSLASTVLPLLMAIRKRHGTDILYKLLVETMDKSGAAVLGSALNLCGDDETAFWELMELLEPTYLNEEQHTGVLVTGARLCGVDGGRERLLALSQKIHEQKCGPITEQQAIDIIEAHLIDNKTSTKKKAASPTAETTAGGEVNKGDFRGAGSPQSAGESEGPGVLGYIIIAAMIMTVVINLIGPFL